MRCECCGRETDILIEIGAVSPQVATTGEERRRSRRYRVES